MHRSCQYTLAAGSVASLAHLGDVIQELGAGEAVLCGAAAGSVVEQSEERRVQLKQPARQIPNYSKGARTQQGLPNIHTDTKIN